MTPEEGANKKIFWVLQKIRERKLISENEMAIELNDLINSEINLHIDEAYTILRKLVDLEAISEPIQHPDLEKRKDLQSLYFFSINEKKFDEIYRLYESGKSYLDNKKTVAELKGSQSIIRPKSLELIAKEIGDLDSGSNLVEFLTNCGVRQELIEYPNTKWLMVYSVLLTLASSSKKEDRRMLFKIIEEACHPLMHNGNKNLAKKTTDKLNSLLEYDNFFLKNGVLWQGWDDGVGLSWYDKDDNDIEDNFSASCVIFPKQIDKLYIYWNELIKLTKFYFNNKERQTDEINHIYFEIISNFEDVLNGEGCGHLKEVYKKPFRNMVGCEFEIQKQGLTVDGLFVNLYDFLGEITGLSLPDKTNVEKIKEGNSAFFSKIKSYVEQHQMKKTEDREQGKDQKILDALDDTIIRGFKSMFSDPSDQQTKQTIQKIEITKIPELEIKGLERGLGEYYNEVIFSEMIVDTITLQIERLEIDERYLARLQALRSSQTLRYIFNPNVSRDGYLPRITIKKQKSQFGTGFYTESIDIEFSAPKIVYGTNYFGIDENDYNSVVDGLFEKLKFIFGGYEISREQIQRSNIKTIAFAFNFILPKDYAHPVEFLKIIPFFDIGKNYNRLKDTYYTEGTEIGFCGRIYNKQVSWKLYDKGAEIIDNAKSTEEIRTASGIKQGLLPNKVLRLEITYQNRFSLKRHLATRTDHNNERERHLCEVFNNKLCQSILLESFNKFANEVNVQALDVPIYPVDSFLKIAKGCRMSLYDAYALLGRSLATQQAGSLQLKLMSDSHYSKQDRSRADKKFKKLILTHPIPSFTLKKFLEECRKQLVDFKIMKPDNLPT